ncbi:MAG: pH regulation protein F [Alphaproteobacteria bacterium]|nr:pH regulation protein F [Alphaproteobacteria bacterium]
MIYAAVAAAMIVAMALALVRAFAGPTLYDRVLAGNAFGTKTVILLGILGYLTDRPDFLDIALLYALINFAGTIAILKFFRYRTLTTSMDDLDEPSFAEPAPAPAAGAGAGGGFGAKNGPTTKGGANA